jgi:hypothetical protein
MSVHKMLACVARGGWRMTGAATPGSQTLNNMIVGAAGLRFFSSNNSNETTFDLTGAFEVSALRLD